MDVGQPGDVGPAVTDLEAEPEREPAVSVGRIVRYVGEGGLERYAAIVTAVHADGTTVDLTAFPPAGHLPWPRTGVRKGSHAGSWCWPPRG